MQVNLTSGLNGTATVKYIYDDDGEPYATKVRLTLLDKDNQQLEFEGDSKVKWPDQFSRKKGRKWAMMNLFRKDSIHRLNKKDRQELFEEVCPWYFVTEIEDDIPHDLEDFDWKTVASEKGVDWFDGKAHNQAELDYWLCFRFSIYFNLILWGGIGIVYSIFH